MDMPLVSIIVPIYKVELYLRQCIESIINQTYINLEIILVDDGSPDQSPKICDEYTNMDNRIKVIHKKNGGLSDARNAGMEIALGEYLCFVDSDDVIHHRIIEILMQPLIKDADLKMSACHFIKFCKDSELQVVNNNTKDFKYSIVDYKTFFTKCWTVSWAKIYKKELFKQIKFPFGRLHEDDFTTYKLVYKSQKVALTTSQLYFYRQREGSIVSNRSTKSFIDTHDALKEQIEFYIKKQEWFLYCRVLVRFAKQYAIGVQTIIPNDTIFIQWKKELKKYPIGHLSLKQKISYMSYICCPKARLFVQRLITK